MACLADSIVDPPMFHQAEKATYRKRQVTPLHLKQQADSLFSFLSWYSKNEAGDIALNDDSVDAAAHSVDTHRRTPNLKRGPSPPPRGPSPIQRAPSPPPCLAGLNKFPPLLLRSLHCASESDVDRGLQNVDTNIDTGREEDNWLVDDSVDSLEIKVKPRRLDVGDSVDRHGSVESLSYGVDAHSNASETSNKDWEAHEAESILSEIYDLGEECICLMHPCICNLDENAFPDLELKNNGKVSPRLPRKHVSARIRQRERAQMQLSGEKKSASGGAQSQKDTAAENEVKGEGGLWDSIMFSTNFLQFGHGGTDVDSNDASESELVKSHRVVGRASRQSTGVDDVSFLPKKPSGVGHASRQSTAVDAPDLSSVYSSAVDAGDSTVFTKRATSNLSMSSDNLVQDSEEALRASEMFSPYVDPSKTADTVAAKCSSSLKIETPISSQNVAIQTSATKVSVQTSTHSLAASVSRRSIVGSDTGKECIMEAIEYNARLQESLAIEREVTVAHQCIQVGSPEAAAAEEEVQEIVEPVSPYMQCDTHGDVAGSPPRVVRHPVFPVFPTVLDRFCFSADRQHSSDVDHALAADNGEEVAIATDRPDFHYADYLPDDGVDGTGSMSEYSEGNAVDGTPGRSSSPRRCHSDPDMIGSKTDPDNYPSSFPRRSSRIPRRVLKPGEKASEQELPSQKEDKQRRSPGAPNYRKAKLRKQAESGSARPPSEEGQDAASMCRSPSNCSPSIHSPCSRSPASRSPYQRSPVSPSLEDRHLRMPEAKTRDQVSTVITTDNRSKPYVPQVITFYTHKDGKVATTIPPPAPIRRTPPVKTPDLPPWNPSTLIEKPKTYCRPQPLHYRRHESCHSLGGQNSDSGKFSLLNEDCLDKMSLQDMGHSDAQRACSPSKKPPAYPKVPFRPAGPVSERRRNMPINNTDRSHPELRVPCGKTDVPVAYPSLKSASNTTTDVQMAYSSTKSASNTTTDVQMAGVPVAYPSTVSDTISRTSRMGEGEDCMLESDEQLIKNEQYKPLYSPGPESYVYPAYTDQSCNNNNNNNKSNDNDNNTNGQNEQAVTPEESNSKTSLCADMSNYQYYEHVDELMDMMKIQNLKRPMPYIGRYPMLPGVSKHTLRYLYKCSPLQEKRTRRPMRSHNSKSPSRTPPTPSSRDGTPKQPFNDLTNPLLHAPPVLSSSVRHRWNTVLINHYLDPPEDYVDTGMPISDVVPFQ